MVEIVKAVTSDGLVLKALYSAGAKDKPVVIHIHGYGQDFFTNDFIPIIASTLKQQDRGFLSIQTRGTGTISRIFTTNFATRLCGSAYEVLEEAHLDIEAWVQWLLDQGYSSLVLQGHSLGAIKVIRYLVEGASRPGATPKDLKKSIQKIILLSPYDKNFLIKQQVGVRYQEFLILAKEKISSGQGWEFVPKAFDSNPHTYQSWHSFYQDSDLSNMFDFHKKDYPFPTLSQLEVPVKVIVGSQDPYFHPSNPDHPEEAQAILTKFLPNSEVVMIEGTKHRFLKKELELATEILKFL